MLELNLNMKLLEMCSKCGACYSICPSCTHLPGYDPRQVVADIVQGKFEKWLSSSSIWQCLECHYCLEMCYQHYGFENAMTALRTIATKRGLNPPQVKRGWDMFAKTGKLGEPALPARKKFGLPEPSKSGGEELKKVLDALKDRRGKGHH
ncbi:MAG: 4Fe-4S dicluster domain-containing protein [Deltaproteobacteria bacterium]|nr:4Fe-4S dicluster domain-containing protein [Deltaproteobacteria bacterium]